jgi:hypothetical protein
MDERLQKALEFSNYMVTLNNQKRMLKEKYYEDLIYFFNGAQFTITKELITFVGLMLEKGNDNNIVITDDNDVPSRIENVNEFYDAIVDCYYTASNKYYTEYELLKKKRKIDVLVGYNDV